jgi:hypothetical protein
MERSESDRKREDERNQLVPFLTWGWQFAVMLGFFAWGGHWLDQKFETRILFVLIGIFLGLFGGFYHLYRIVSQLPKQNRKK